MFTMFSASYYIYEYLMQNLHNGSQTFPSHDTLLLLFVSNYGTRITT